MSNSKHKKLEVGDVVINKHGEKAKVILYKRSDDISIKFLDDYGHEKSVSAASIRQMVFKNPYRKSVFGVGYLGEGEFNSGTRKNHTTEYDLWKSMLSRCYDPRVLNEQPTYRDCTVHESWHNFQVFAKWVTSQKHYGMGYALDKDLLVLGNKVYSEKTCCLIPAELNALMLTPNNLNRKHLPGVSFSKKWGKFASRVSIEGKRVSLGYYDTDVEAHEVYMKARINYVKNKAEDFKNMVDRSVYESLISWCEKKRLSV